MKNHIAFILLTTILVACQQNLEETTGNILQGEIRNTIGGSLTISNPHGFERTINVKDDGLFVDTLDVPEGMYYAQYEKTVIPFYLNESSKIKFSADANDFYSTLRFEGDNANLNNYYAFKSSFGQNVQSSFQTVFGMSEDDFLNFIDSTKQVMLGKFEKIPGITDSIRNLERNAIDFYAEGLIRDYPIYHPYISKNEEYKPSDDFTSQLKEIDYTREEDFFYSRDYNSSLFTGVMRDADRLTKKDTTLSQREAEMKVIAAIKNKPIRENLLATFAEMALSLMEEGRKEYYKKYMSLSEDPQKQEKVTNLFESLALLEPGNPSPKFKDYESYTGGKISLDDFKGKYVYIDVWATWCGPCKAEIPFLKDIEEEFQDRNIEFVSISVDTRPDYQKWRDMIAEKEMGGTQLFANDAFNSSFIKAYQIRGIPQFILLDPEGNIVNAQAPRPSEKDQLTKILNSLKI